MTNASSDQIISRYSPIIELRRYRLHPNKFEDLIDIFDTHFLEGQEQYGMKIIGQFRDMDDPDAFVWFRGFEDMQARHQALTGFYDGPVWGEHRSAANATMIDSDNVLLLHPAGRNLDFELPTTRNANLLISTDTQFQITTFNLKAPAEDGFLDFYERVIAPILDSAGDNRISLLASEHGENSFTRLPVRLEENVLVSVSRFESAAAQAGFAIKLASSEAFAGVQEKLSPWLVAPTVIARLEPTDRSLLR